MQFLRRYHSVVKKFFFNLPENFTYFLRKFDSVFKKDLRNSKKISPNFEENST